MSSMRGPWAKLMRAVLVAACMSAALSLLGCSDTDTVVALTVMSGDDVGQVELLRIDVTQSGQAAFVRELVPPTQTTDAGARIKPSFYERLILPESFERGPAEIEVKALDRDGKVRFSAKTGTRIRPEGAVTASVMLGSGKPPEPPESPDAGADAGGDASADDDDAGS